MKQLFGFAVLYGMLGAVTWILIDADPDYASTPLEASATPLGVRGETPEPFEPATVLPRDLSLASPIVPAPALAPTTPWMGGMEKTILSELRCLALNIYWEARSESPKGQFAVAAVTLNRVAHERFPGTICGVVMQGGAERRHQCQFSWWCDGKSDKPTNNAAWQAAKSIAYTALFFDPPDPTQGALWYHADYVKPSWSRSMSRTATIGRHVYYRKPVRVSGVRLASRT